MPKHDPRIVEFATKMLRQLEADRPTQTWETLVDYIAGELTTVQDDALEAAAQTAEAWIPFVEKRLGTGIINQDEYNINHAVAIVIARKIRFLKAIARPEDPVENGEDEL